MYVGVKKEKIEFIQMIMKSDKIYGAKIVNYIKKNYDICFHENKMARFIELSAISY